MRHLLAISFIAVAVLWSSASALPHDESVKDYLWLDEFDTASAEISNEISPKKRSVESASSVDASDDIFEDSSDESVNSKRFYELYAHAVTDVAPLTYKPALKQKIEELVQKEYLSFEDFHKDVYRVFEEVTGLNLDEYVSQYYDESQSEEESE